MKLLLIALMLLAAALAPPVSRSAHRRVPRSCCRQLVPRPRPIRVLRTPQGPKVVRTVR